MIGSIGADGTKRSDGKPTRRKKSLNKPERKKIRASPFPSVQIITINRKEWGKQSAEKLSAICSAYLWAGKGKGARYAKKRHYE